MDSKATRTPCSALNRSLPNCGIAESCREKSWSICCFCWPTLANCKEPTLPLSKGVVSDSSGCA